MENGLRETIFVSVWEVMDRPLIGEGRHAFTLPPGTVIHRGGVNLVDGLLEIDATFPAPVLE